MNKTHEKNHTLLRSRNASAGSGRRSHRKLASQRPAVPLLRINDRNEFVADRDRNADIRALEFELFASIIE